jgi:hypothetical protein|tara:strand:+ start:51 stop:326 length:276 start_codon:yes stop_codon:yes gene_type:complete
MIVETLIIFSLKVRKLSGDKMFLQRICVMGPFFLLDLISYKMTKASMEKVYTYAPNSQVAKERGHFKVLNLNSLEDWHEAERKLGSRERSV